MNREHNYEQDIKKIINQNPYDLISKMLKEYHMETNKYTQNTQVIGDKNPRTILKIFDIENVFQALTSIRKDPNYKLINKLGLNSRSKLLMYFNRNHCQIKLIYNLNGVSIDTFVVIDDLSYIPIYTIFSICINKNRKITARYYQENRIEKFNKFCKMVLNNNIEVDEIAVATDSLEWEEINDLWFLKTPKPGFRKLFKETRKTPFVIMEEQFLKEEFPNIFQFYVLKDKSCK